MIEQVTARFGAKAVQADRAEIVPWLTDWRGKFHGTSAAILSPSSTAQAAEMVRLAAEFCVALVPQGGNTGMVGGATPPEDGSAVILSTRRMNRIRSLDAEAGVAVVEAGVILANLHDAAEAQGWRFPLTLGSRGSCTIGGLIATNAGGTQVLRFGTMRALVLGIEAVLPDGTIHDGLSGLKKDNRGYSFDQLLAGSEGTLGVITAAALRLVPAIRNRAVSWLGLRSPTDALSVLRALEKGTTHVEGFEIVPRDSLELVLKHIPGTRPPLERQHVWNVLVELTDDGSLQETPEALLERLLEPLIDSGLAEDATIAANEAQAEALWRIRDSISEAERTEGPTLAHDISVPVADMPRFMTEAAAEVERAFPGTAASGFGHLGDGNVHFHVRPATGASAEAFAGQSASITRLVHDLVTAAGGSISAEHGIGQMKRDELARLAPERVAHLKAIKQALDPKGIMNPGKLV
ncbi:FAD-binding oxidoreductase [Sphingomonas sp. SE158]|uniref:FAD-binding oxidoreductase n=1 Tax=Sphingomonas alba TaxID=2908208 RepID=A0ABT0RKU2_9SPHN|nr:FAD-binding oxidoreductase [Sphingomonas alba]MCL6683246.1 FAD-binding oxidoreductase [Sphingomonas alba]